MNFAQVQEYVIILIYDRHHKTQLGYNFVSKILLLHISKVIQIQ